MVGWHHWFNGYESEQTLRDSEGQGSPVCCSSWCCKELGMTLVTEKQPFHRDEEIRCFSTLMTKSHRTALKSPLVNL